MLIALSFKSKNMKNNIYLGVDIGATKTIFLLVEIIGARYKILKSDKIATPRKENDILKMVKDRFQDLSLENEISAIGIGFAGPVDFENGKALAGPNLKTGKIEFKKLLEKNLKVPVAVDNDARCFVISESIFGAAKEYSNIIGLTIGTGIGGGIIINGKIYRGSTGSAGEFGHTEIFKSKELEDTASGSGLVNVYRKLAGKKITSFEIVELAEKKDKKALEAINFVADSLSSGIADVVESFNPEIIVIGGGLAEVDLIIKKAKEYVKKKEFLPSLVRTPIVVSKLGQSAVALGASWLAKKAVK
jgi:glucokinase